MTNIPASSMYSVRSGSTKSRTVSVTDSPLATSSNASSEPSVNNNSFILDGSELDDIHDFGSERGNSSPVSQHSCRWPISACRSSTSMMIKEQPVSKETGIAWHCNTFMYHLLGNVSNMLPILVILMIQLSESSFELFFSPSLSSDEDYLYMNFAFWKSKSSCFNLSTS